MNSQTKQIVFWIIFFAVVSGISDLAEGQTLMQVLDHLAMLSVLLLVSFFMAIGYTGSDRGY